MNPPQTIIVVHPRERRSKCSVEPLRSHSQFVFWDFPTRGPEPLDGYVRLGIGGPLLSEDDQDSGLLVLDGTWRLADRMEKLFLDVPVRSLPHWQTAYPRVSKNYSDPQEGLATIEALFAALHILGRDTSDLLDSYHWKQHFLELNQRHLEDCG